MTKRNIFSSRDRKVGKPQQKLGKREKLRKGENKPGRKGKNKKVLQIAPADR